MTCVPAREAVSQPHFPGRLFETRHVTKPTLVKLFDINDINDVMSKMLVKHTKMNMSGGPRTGEICGCGQLHNLSIDISDLYFICDILATYQLRRFRETNTFQ